MLKLSFLIMSLTLFAACTNGGSLQLQPGATKVRDPGSPYVYLNSGGKALVVETGKTATTGVHGWVSVQPVSATGLQGGSGTTATILSVRQPASTTTK